MKKLLLVKESVYCFPGIWADHYSILSEMYKELPDYMRSATVVATGESVEELYQYFS